MRKVTVATVSAFIAGNKISMGNTTVSVVDGHDVALSLHGHIIALHNTKTGEIKINNKGYETNVTKERLNGIISDVCGYSQCIYQRNWAWYWDIDGVKTDFPSAEWVTIRKGK